MKGVTFKFDDLIYHESFFLYTKLVAFRCDVCSLIYGDTFDLSFRNNSKRLLI